MLLTRKARKKINKEGITGQSPVTNQWQTRNILSDTVERRRMFSGKFHTWHTLDCPFLRTECVFLDVKTADLAQQVSHSHHVTKCIFVSKTNKCIKLNYICTLYEIFLSFVKMVFLWLLTLLIYHSCKIIETRAAVILTLMRGRAAGVAVQLLQLSFDSLFHHLLCSDQSMPLLFTVMLKLTGVW